MSRAHNNIFGNESQHKASFDDPSRNHSPEETSKIIIKNRVRFVADPVVLNLEESSNGNWECVLRVSGGVYGANVVLYRVRYNDAAGRYYIEKYTTHQALNIGVELVKKLLED